MGLGCDYYSWTKLWLRKTVPFSAGVFHLSKSPNYHKYLVFFHFVFDENEEWFRAFPKACAEKGKIALVKSAKN